MPVFFLRVMFSTENIKETDMKKTLIQAMILGFMLIAAASVQAAGKEESARYTNSEAGFSFIYPDSFKTEQTLFPDEQVRLAVQNDFKVPVLTASIKEDAGKTPLEELPGKVLAFMQAAMPDTSQYSVLNQDIVTLESGQQAVLVQFTWLLGDKSTMMETASIMAYDGDSLITITGNTIKDIGFPVSELAKICMTLRIDG